jgi:hypothetical protein
MMRISKRIVAAAVLVVAALVGLGVATTSSGAGHATPQAVYVDFH